MVYQARCIVSKNWWHFCTAGSECSIVYSPGFPVRSSTLLLGTCALRSRLPHKQGCVCPRTHTIVPHPGGALSIPRGS